VVTSSQNLVLFNDSPRPTYVPNFIKTGEGGVPTLGDLSWNYPVNSNTIQDLYVWTYFYVPLF